jgi:hypothetical protein
VHKLSGKELLKKTGLQVIFVVVTLILLIFLVSVLQHFKLNENVAYGVPVILTLYFWGGYFMRKHGWGKTLGVVLYLVAFFINLVFLASPYNTVAEFKSTRIFLLFPFLAGIFLITQQGKLLRLLGVLIIILAVFGAFLGALFVPR